MSHLKMIEKLFSVLPNIFILLDISPPIPLPNVNNFQIIITGY